MIFILFFLLQAFLSMRFQCFVINLFEFTVPKTSVNVESKKKKKIIFGLLFLVLDCFLFTCIASLQKKKKSWYSKWKLDKKAAVTDSLL